MMTKVKEELNDLAGFNYKTMANRNAHNGPFGAVRTTQFVTDVQIINNELADFTVNTRQLFRCTGSTDYCKEAVRVVADVTTAEDPNLAVHTPSHTTPDQAAAVCRKR